MIFVATRFGEVSIAGYRSRRAVDRHDATAVAEYRRIEC